jgi:hypothetical protein
MSRLRGAIAVVLLVCSVLAPFGVGVAGAVPDARLAVTGVAVSPETPTAGAPITVAATVRLSAGSQSAATLDRVAVVDAEGRVVGAATDLGSLSPGETLTVPVSVTFGSPGERDLTVVATVSDADGDRARARRPLSLPVERGGPLVELGAPSAVAGADSGVRATVSNPTAAPLRDLTVSVIDPADGQRLRRTVATLAAGESRTVNFSVRPAEAGERALAVRVDYTTAAGTRATWSRERTVDVAALSDDVGVRVARSSTGDDASVGAVGGGGLAGLLGGDGGALRSAGRESEDADRARVEVTVTNFGNAAVEDVVVVPRAANGSLLAAVGRVAAAGALGPGESATVTVDLGGVETADTLRFAARYDLAGERREAATRYEFRPGRGDVELTGVNVNVSRNGRVALGGNLGNVGDGEVTGVVVAVGDGEFVAPRYPRRSYFVGTVAASEFAPFRLTARADLANATAVPVRVAYTVGNDRVTETVRVSLPDEADADGPSDRLFGAVADPPLLVAVLLACGAVASAAIGLLLGRYR